MTQSPGSTLVSAWKTATATLKAGRTDSPHPASRRANSCRNGGKPSAGRYSASAAGWSCAA